MEINPKKALALAAIENKYGHKGSFYVQTDLLEEEKNIKCLKAIQPLEHEVTYHLDVMDQYGGEN